MASWSFVLTDSNFVPQGEVINAAARQVALPLNKLPTASLTMRLDNPLADLAMSTSCWLKGYRWVAGTPTLDYFGPVVSAEEVATSSSQTIALNSVGAGWVFQKRLCGKSGLGVAYTNIDRAKIFAGPNVSGPISILAQAQVEGETHIDFSNDNLINSASTANYTTVYNTLMSSVDELANTSNGFDWRVTPIDNWSNSALVSQKAGRFEAYPIIGQQQTNAVFEYGTGKSNLAGYKRTVDRTTQANKVYHNAPSGPDTPGFPTVSAINPSSINDWGLLEDLVQAQLLDQTLRQSLVDEHVAVRSYPRQLIELTPHIDPYDTGRAPIFGVDYNVGDTVRARAVYGSKLRFDVWIRVWGITFNIDAQGLETPTLVLAQQ